ncbi:YceD family protein [Anaerosphaera multitolerans]|uniref:DUF177 domain-containing protein n=1 Tax=Anaerosphaera multitolerans TaxID=2487351 RepID=A0A437S7C0_9FIRM|nr:DUF177 domain-containing protein [Anaerosphaera multitolerans]RVU54892.1 DUF177 domain-containing protein [Anaerosphaera multitolerans]
MKLDIRDFLQSSDYKMEFNGQLKEQKSNYDISDLDLIFPVDYDGIIFNLGDEIMLDLSVKYKYNTQCDRCLKPMIEDVETNLKAFFLKDIENVFEDEASKEYFDLIDNQIFLDDLIISQIITSIPFKSLCKEECKGICPKCGKDLNEGSCKCDEEIEIDPRFGKLMDLFNDEEV